MKRNKLFEKNAWFLIRELAWTDFKLRYNSSIFGYLWSLLVPIMIFGVLYLVFSVFIRFEKISHYPLFLLLGIILWNFFADASQMGMQSIQRKAMLISSMNFPKWYIVFASNITSVLTLCLNLFVFGGFFIFTSVPIKLAALLMPIYIFELVIFTFFFSLFLSSFFLRFRDLSHIWGIVLQIGFWFTPIVYPVDIIPVGLRPLIMINPLARLIQDCRSVLIYHSVSGFGSHLITFLMIFGIVIFAMVVFSKRSKYFAEEI